MTLTQNKTKRNFFSHTSTTHKQLLPLSNSSWAIMTPPKSNTTRNVSSASTGKSIAKFTPPGATVERVGTRLKSKSASSSPFGVVSTASSTSASSTISSPASSTSTMASSMMASHSFASSSSHETPPPRALIFSE